METLRRILVTGGAGYIGSHTTKPLLRSGYRPVVFDNLSTGHAGLVRHCSVVRGDPADRERPLDTLRRLDIEAAIHFAASACVGESVRNPRSYFQNNAVNSLNLLNAMWDAGVGTVAFSSSCATYGSLEPSPIVEEHPQRPINPYGESKLFVERVLHWYGGAYGLRWCALRYCNAAGAGPDGDQGEMRDPETHLTPLVVKAALGTGPPSAVFGTGYSTVGGTAVRDYVQVNDLAPAYAAALEYLSAGGAGAAFSLGTGKGHSVRGAIRSVGKLGGPSVPAIEHARRPGAPAVLAADAAKATAVLGWNSELPDLDTMAGTAWCWERRKTGWRWPQPA